MANQPSDDKAYDKAREVTEKALDAYVKNDDKEGDKLVEKANSIDPDAVKDVHADLEEDAQSEHDPQRLSKTSRT